jgi:SanA protein
MFSKYFKLSLIITSLVLLIITTGNIWINRSTKSKLYSDITTLPYNKVGLIPGCNQYVADGVLNTYYTQRIEAGAKLFRQGKIDYILVSGDNAHASYDEPRAMKKSLIESGVPKDRIYSDYAGFRTLDTIVRAREVFQLKEVTLISQSFQNRRGVFIGEKRDIDIVAFNVEPLGIETNYKTRIREVFAKMKMLLDLYILDKEPKFLGDEIIIGE